MKAPALGVRKSRGVREKRCRGSRGLRGTSRNDLSIVRDDAALERGLGAKTQKETNLKPARAQVIEKLCFSARVEPIASLEFQ
jgi:hypothetical protein